MLRSKLKFRFLATLSLFFYAKSFNVSKPHIQVVADHVAFAVEIKL